MSITITETCANGAKVKFTLDQFVANMRRSKKSIPKKLADEMTSKIYKSNQQACLRAVFEYEHPGFLARRKTCKSS